ncbi:MAG: rhodanese-like domain-containing protein [Pseudomonadota bacterium]
MTGEIAGIAQLNPAAAWAAVEAGAALIDVRTRPEWTFVGVPDLTPLGAEAILVEWKSWPVMAPNAAFVDDVLAALDGTIPEQTLFLCRSGVRSQDAALTVQAALQARGVETRCCNVAEGFEGDLGPDGRRGTVNGWKARGLPWRQS